MTVACTASPGVTNMVPILELLPFHTLLTDEEDKHLDINNGSAASSKHMKKSFNFTWELKKLNKAGASECRPFIEHSTIQPKWISVTVVSEILVHGVSRDSKFAVNRINQ